MRSRKPRPPRVERTENMDIHDETEHLWAVSYADFLMVLLSFFILFFSVDKDDKSSVIKRVLSKTDTKAADGTGDGKSSGHGDGTNENQSYASVSDIETKLDGFKFYSDPVERKVVLDFEENIYGTGEIGLPGSSVKQLRSVLKVLYPLKDKIGITMIGYTDNGTIKFFPERLIKSNFDVSALRASKATVIAQAMGYSPLQLQARGVHDAKRNSRTLSLEIYPLKANVRLPASSAARDYDDQPPYYGVQVFASKDENVAYKMAGGLSFLDAVTIVPRESESGTWYRVVVGKSADLATMTRYRNRLMKAMKRKDFFIRMIGKSRNPASVPIQYRRIEE